MARCPFCNQILDDAWLKREGASLMGRAHGKAKSRPADVARATAMRRWGKSKEEKAQDQKSSTVEQSEKGFTALRTLAGVRQPKKHKT